MESIEALAAQLYVEAQTTSRDPRRLPKLLLTAAVLVWRTNRWSTVGVVASQLLSAVLSAGQVLIASVAVHELLRGGLTQITGRLVLLLVALGVLTVFAGLAATAGTQLGRVLGLEVTRQVTDDVLDVTTTVELVEFDDAGFHDQLNRVLATMPTRPYEVITAGATFVGGAAGTAAMVVSLAVIHPLLVIVLALVGLPLWLTSRRAGSLEFELAVEQTTAMREREYLTDLMTRRENAAELRSLGTARLFRDRFTALYESYLQAVRRLVRRRYVLSVVGTALAGLAALLVVGLLYLLVDAGWVDVSRATAALLALRLIVGRAGMLAEGAGSLYESALFLRDYQNFTHRPHRRIEIPPNAEGSRQADGDIRVDAVDFQYPGDDRDALVGLSLTIPAGATVALVGENGSGKSTLAKLLSGLYEPTSGSVIWHDANGRRVSRTDAARSSSVVFQDFLRYQLTVADNITLGRAGVRFDSDRMRQAARQARLDGVVAALPAQYETRLSRLFAGGRDLSLGQWQRVALARTYYRDSPLVILDEPASALDPRAEAALYASVNEMLAERTVVMVTHRLRSVRHVQQIVVLHEGRMVEQGDHETLMALGGIYAGLYTLQDEVGLRNDGIPDIGAPDTQTFLDDLLPEQR